MMRAEDAAAAARAGADAIGLVFYDAAARRVTVEQARAIINVLPPFVTPVGLFVDAAPEAVLDVARQLNLRQVQLHGHESPEDVAKLAGLSIIKAIRVERDRLRQTLDDWRGAIRDLHLTNLSGLLMETAATAAPGGTGVENDWETIAAAQDAGALADLPPIIAAGGLTPQNVAAVVRRLRPWAVDVSSGVESSRGVKSVERMRAFVEAVELPVAARDCGRGGGM
jgi:phosphoribosylanthranilate isomerase